MTAHDPLAELSTQLLMAIAAGDTNAATEYDALLFDFLRNVAQTRGRFLAADAASRTGATPLGAQLPLPDGIDLDEAASLAAQIALARARASALRFDHTRGDGASWALGNLGHAYRDAQRELGRTRRLLVEVPVEDELLQGYAGMAPNDPYEAAAERDSLERALDLLDDDERYVIIAQVHYGLTYREIAVYRFDDPEATKKVDRLLQSAKHKLRQAHELWVEQA
jgi:DNA-directed RNA polymerase specialized sigma24 family protein